MKTFINAIRFALVTLLFVSVTALGFGNCCQTKCQTRTSCEKTCSPCAAPSCRIQPAPVEISRVCNERPGYKVIQRIEMVPCPDKVETFTVCPKFLGCFREDGTAVEDHANSANGNITYANETQNTVVAPIAHKKQVRTNSKMSKRYKNGNNNRNLVVNKNEKDLNFSADMTVSD